MRTARYSARWRWKLGLKPPSGGRYPLAGDEPTAGAIRAMQRPMPRSRAIEDHLPVATIWRAGLGAFAVVACAWFALGAPPGAGHETGRAR